jgi:hypothetical protein
MSGTVPERFFSVAVRSDLWRSHVEALDSGLDSTV